MTLLVKAVNGIIVEIYGIGLEEYKFGGIVHGQPQVFVGEHYFKVVSPSIGVNWVSHITKNMYLSLIDTDAFPRKVDTSNGKVWFRFHRGLLVDSMKTAVQVASKEELKQLLIKSLGDFINPAGELEISKYGCGIDDRIGWDTYIVQWDGIVQGFLSSYLEGDVK